MSKTKNMKDITKDFILDKIKNKKYFILMRSYGSHVFGEIISNVLEGCESKVIKDYLERKGIFSDGCSFHVVSVDKDGNI